MAAVCGSTLSLMDAGVPIINPVAGISIGLVLDGKKHVLLTDIQGAEDHSGDMDFKVAGTKNGITAIQLDVKTKELTVDILKDALEKAKSARKTLLDLIVKTISKPKDELSKYAPKIKTIKINPTKIGMIIGPGGKIINQMTQDYGVSIDIEEDGTIFITSDDLEGIAKAESQIKEITFDPEVGGIYKAQIVKIMDFGAFAKIPGGQEGLIHVSQLSDEHVKNVTDVVSVGDEVTVKLVQIDDMGRLNLSIKQASPKN
jgi:polyribonucleotide nucleotidyltransferase